MILYVNGCSHSHGHCVSKEDVWSNIIMNTLSENYITFNSNLSGFTEDLIINQNSFYINESRCGAGNDYIFHSSLESITRLIDVNKKPNYVFIQWSGPNRRMYCEPNGQIVYVNLYDNVDYLIKFEPMASIHTLHYIYTLQEFLKKHNIEYVFLNYMELDKSIKNNPIYNKIDLKRYVYFDGLLEYVLKNNLSCDDHGHPNVDGNKFIAKLIIDKING